MSKFSVKHPAYYCGKVVLEFYNNEDEEFKNKALKRLSKDIQKNFHVSATVSEENLVENPERGVLVFACTGATLEQVRNTGQNVMAFLDQNSPGRIISEDHVEEEFP